MLNGLDCSQHPNIELFFPIQLSAWLHSEGAESCLVLPHASHGRQIQVASEWQTISSSPTFLTLWPIFILVSGSLHSSLELLQPLVSICCRWIRLPKQLLNSQLWAQVGRSNDWFSSTWPITMNSIPTWVITSVRNPHKYHKGYWAVSIISSNSENTKCLLHRAYLWKAFLLL